MDVQSPGSSAAVELVSRPRRDLTRCIICQTLQDSIGCKKLTSTPDGRRVIIETSRILQDDVLLGLNEEEHSKIHYHVKSCYARYKRAGERESARGLPEKRQTDESIANIDVTSPVRQKRQIPLVQTDPRKKNPAPFVNK